MCTEDPYWLGEETRERTGTTLSTADLEVQPNPSISLFNINIFTLLRHSVFLTTELNVSRFLLGLGERREGEIVLVLQNCSVKPPTGPVQ